jgi:hypothetical protein
VWRDKGGRVGRRQPAIEYAVLLMREGAIRLEFAATPRDVRAIRRPDAMPVVIVAAGCLGAIAAYRWYGLVVARRAALRRRPAAGRNEVVLERDPVTGVFRVPGV